MGLGLRYDVTTLAPMPQLRAVPTAIAYEVSHRQRLSPFFKNKKTVFFVSLLAYRLVLQSDYAMEIYKSLNNTDEDPPGEQIF